MRKRIVLVCLAGMSTNMLVNRMRRASASKHQDVDIVAISASEVESDIKNQPTDLYLLGPQVRYLKSEIETQLKSKKVPVKNIDMTDYGLMDGYKVFEFAEKALNMDEKNENPS